MGKPIPVYVLNRIAKWMRIRERVLVQVPKDANTLRRDKDDLLKAIKSDFEFDRDKAVDHLATEIFESWTKEYGDPDVEADQDGVERKPSFQMCFAFGDGFYDPDRLVILDGERDDGRGGIIKVKQTIADKDCTPADKRQETNRKRTHAKAAFLRSEYATNVQSEFDQWALEEASKGRPVFELRYHAFLAETGALKAL